MMKKFLDKYFPYKFEVRVIHKESYTTKPTEEGYFNIEYCYYRYFKTWNTLERYLIHVNSWNPCFFCYTKTVKIAKKFKTIEDIHLWYAEHAKEEAKWVEPPASKPVPQITYINKNESN